MHAPKKPKGKELITAEKQENRRISGIRIKVEHAIGGMKKCRIVKERFRCHKFGFEDMVILIACGLHNFRITHKMSHITVLCDGKKRARRQEIVRSDTKKYK